MLSAAAIMLATGPWWVLFKLIGLIPTDWTLVLGLSLAMPLAWTLVNIEAKGLPRFVPLLDPVPAEGFFARLPATIRVPFLVGFALLLALISRLIRGHLPWQATIVTCCILIPMGNWISFRVQEFAWGKPRKNSASQQFHDVSPESGIWDREID